MATSGGVTSAPTVIRNHVVDGYGTLAERPEILSVEDGFVYYSTDTKDYFVSNGTDWVSRAIVVDDTAVAATIIVDKALQAYTATANLKGVFQYPTIDQAFVGTNTEEEVLTTESTDPVASSYLRGQVEVPAESDGRTLEANASLQVNTVGVGYSIQVTRDGVPWGDPVVVEADAEDYPNISLQNGAPYDGATIEIQFTPDSASPGSITIAAFSSLAVSWVIPPPVATVAITGSLADMVDAGPAANVDTGTGSVADVINSLVAAGLMSPPE